MPKPPPLLKGFEKTVHRAKANPEKRTVIFDGETQGLALMVSPKGKKSFYVVARDPGGKQVWKRIGDPRRMTVAEARKVAAEAVERVKDGDDPIPAPEPPEAAPDTFKEVAERFITQWVDQGGKKQNGVPLASRYEIVRQFNTYIYPRWADKPFTDIRRPQVVALMDEMAANNGRPQADKVLATLSKLFNWFRQYDEFYTNPIIPELKRAGRPADRKRHRAFSDDEIRAIWSACEALGSYGAFIRLALLTGQRSGKLQLLRWDAIRDGVWEIPDKDHQKGHAGQLPLPPLALKLISELPQIEGNPYVFAGRGDKPLYISSKLKRGLDEIASLDEPWVVHDLRSAAKSLMARVGVRPDISERVLGHKQKGVEGVYDRYDYTKEKGDALEALASLMERILEGEADNIVQLKATAE